MVEEKSDEEEEEEEKRRIKWNIHMLDNFFALTYSLKRILLSLRNFHSLFRLIRTNVDYSQTYESTELKATNERW